MCIYCERQSKVGWNQPPLCDENWEHPTDTIKDTVCSNMNIDGVPDWKVKIYDYQSATPMMIATSLQMGNVLMGEGGVASLYIPIKYCPVCGRKLGKQEKRENFEVFYERINEAFTLINGKVYKAVDVLATLEILVDSEEGSEFHLDTFNVDLIETLREEELITFHTGSRNASLFRIKNREKLEEIYNSFFSNDFC